MRALMACLICLVGLGCGHSMTSQIGLMSYGNLEGKIVPNHIDGEIFEGQDCSKIGGDPYSLSEAVRNALEGTQYDTLVDAQVESTTGVFVASNCIKVKGTAIDSNGLADSGDPK